MFAGLLCGAGADGDHREDPDLHCGGEGSVLLHCAVGGGEKSVRGGGGDGRGTRDRGHAA